jgi:hypothetical protein
MPNAWRRHGKVQRHVAEAPLTISKGNGSLGIEAHGNLECAVNVPYRHNWPSTFSYFCNPGETFRASVFCGQAIDLKW